jgi:hypothetical protein
VKVAEGLGAIAHRVRLPGELLGLGRLDPMRNGPILLDIQIDRGVRMPSGTRNDVLRGNQPSN